MRRSLRFSLRELLRAIRFEETEVTGKIGNGGVNATGILNVSILAKVRVYVQAKWYKVGTKINAGVVRQLRMAITSSGQGAFITTADYQRNAYDVATEVVFPSIGLINDRQLVDLLVNSSSRSLHSNKFSCNSRKICWRLGWMRFKNLM